MLDDVLNPDGLFSLYDVRGYDFLLKRVGYQVLPYRQCRVTMVKYYTYDVWVIVSYFFRV